MQFFICCKSLQNIDGAKIPRTNHKDHAVLFFQAAETTRTREVFAVSLTDTALSQDPARQAHEEEGHDGHLVAEVADHVDLPVGPVPLPLAAVVRVLLGGGGAGSGTGNVVPVGIVGREGIHRAFCDTS